jgi:hypothetical protein
MTFPKYMKIFGFLILAGWLAKEFAPISPHLIGVGGEEPAAGARIEVGGLNAKQRRLERRGIERCVA